LLFRGFRSSLENPKLLEDRALCFKRKKEKGTFTSPGPNFVHSIHSFLHRGRYDDPTETVHYGPSTSNQVAIHINKRQTQGGKINDMYIVVNKEKRPISVSCLLLGLTCS